MAIPIITILIYMFFIMVGSDYIIKLLTMISNNNFFIIATSNLILYVLLTIIFIILYKDRLKAAIVDFKEQNIKLDSIVLNYFILMGAAIVGQIILIIIGVDVEKQSINQQGIETLLKSKYALLTVSSVLIGPFVEEIVYRKAIFDIFNEKLNFHPSIICILSGVLFGLIHVILNITSENTSELLMAIPYVLQGIALSFIYVRYKNNIIMPIIIHTLSNFIAILLIVFSSI